MEALLPFFLEIKFAFLCLLSVVLGAILGVEREFRAQPNGMRVHIWVCLSATVLTYIATYLSPNADPTIVIAQMVLGLGLIGAAVVYHTKPLAKGLSIMSTLWLVAVVGVLLGASEWVFAGIVTVVSSVFMFGINRKTYRRNRLNMYCMTIEVHSVSALDDIDALIRQFDIFIENKLLVKDDAIYLELTYSATSLTQHLFLKQLLVVANQSNIGDVTTV